ncbi:MAG: SDR family oxidoreductase [Woeseiaceae bacterium]
MPTLIITGANRGLGLEFVRQYAADGWTIATINRRSSDELDTLAAQHSIQIVTADLTDDEDLRRAVAEIDVPSIDLLINNAGTMGNGSFSAEGFRYQAFGTFNRDEWLRVFSINVCTPMALCELLVDRLQAADKPVVATLSSMLGSNALNTLGNVSGYRASKAAVNSITKSLGINLRERGISCVALHPGWVRTEMGGPDADIDAPESVRGMRHTIAALTPDDSGRFLAWTGDAMPY